MPTGLPPCPRHHGGCAAPSARQRPTGPGRPPPGLLPVRPRDDYCGPAGAATTVTVAVALATGTADGPSPRPATQGRSAGRGLRSVGRGRSSPVGRGLEPAVSRGSARTGHRGDGGGPSRGGASRQPVGTLSSTGACSSVVLTARGTVVAAAGAAGTRAGGPARPVGRRTVPLPVIAPPGAGIGTAPLGPADDCRLLPRTGWHLGRHCRAGAVLAPSPAPTPPASAAGAPSQTRASHPSSGLPNVPIAVPSRYPAS